MELNLKTMTTETRNPNTMDLDTMSPMEILTVLEENNIESRPVWKPMHLQPLFRDRDYVTAGDSSVDEAIFARSLCLPSDIKMTEQEQNRVIDLIRSCF